MSTRTYDKPLPSIDANNRTFWEGCRDGVLLVQQCPGCGARWLPPAPNCPSCLSADVEWTTASGRATLWSWNVFHQAYFEGFKDELPYITALVALEEGPLLTSTLVDVTADELRCDLPLEVVFDPVTDEVSLPKFRPVDAA